MVYSEYTYATLSVQGCCTIGARLLPLSVQGCCHFSFLLEAAVNQIPMRNVSIAMVYCRYTYVGLLVPDSWTLGTRQLDFSGTIIRKSLQWLFCRSSDVVSPFFILIAALRSVSLRLQSLNQKTLTDYHWFITESLHGSVFWFFLFDLYFDFRLIWIVPWQDKWDLRRIFLLIVPCRTRGIVDGLWCEGKCEGRKFTLTLTLTTETPINRAFQPDCEGVRVIK